MENAKRDLHKTYQKHIDNGLKPEEALSKTIVEVRERHQREPFINALRTFIKELSESYSLKNISEADPLVELSEVIYLEYKELLLKVKKLFYK